MLLSLFVICVTITCDVTLHPLPKFKIKKCKIKTKIKIKEKLENKNKRERSLIIKYRKFKVFHFFRLHRNFNPPPLDLSIIKSFIL